MSNLIYTTWVFNDTITYPASGSIGFSSLNEADLFKCGTTKYFEFYASTSINYSKVVGSTLETIIAHDNVQHWVREEYKTLTFLAEPATFIPNETTFMTWLQANAVKIDKSHLIDIAGAEFLYNDLNNKHNTVATKVEGMIDDTAGDGDIDKTWSADKIHERFLKSVDSVTEDTGNLFDVSVDEYDYNGLSVTNNHDGTYTVDGTSRGSNFIRFIDEDHIPAADYHSYFVLDPGTYTIKKGLIDIDGNFVYGSGSNIKFALYDDYSGSSATTSVGDDEYTFTISATKYGRFRIAQSGTVYDNQKIGLYISLGSSVAGLPYTTATDYVAREMASGKYATPYHMYEDAIVRKVLSDRKADTLTVAIITDTHHRSGSEGTRNDTKKQAYAISKLAQKVDASVIIHMGDTTQGGQGTHAKNEGSLIELWTYQMPTYIPILYTIGHHEMYGTLGDDSYMNDPTGLTIDECVGICGHSDKQLFPTYSADRTNWYVDLHGIRLIGLNSVSVSSSRGFRNEDLQFLTQALNNVSVPVVVFSHVAPIMKNKTVNQGVDVINTLNTFITNGGSVIAYIHGHNHLDSYVAEDTDLDGTTIKFKMIGIACAYVCHYDNVSESYYGNPVSPDRTIGTYSEYCFDLVNIHNNSNSKYVNMYRFGAGSDRTS